MSNERKLRLLQVAKEFKVGIATITDFLEKKNIHIESSPNTSIEHDVYAILEKEFGGNRTANDRAKVRERINLKPETVSLHDRKDHPHNEEEEEEVVIKSGVISVKDEVKTGPKIVGKIDLSNGHRQPAAPQPAPAPQSVRTEEPAAAVSEPVPAPKAAAPVSEPAPVQREEPVHETPAPAPAPQPVAAPAMPEQPQQPQSQPQAASTPKYRAVARNTRIMLSSRYTYR